MSHSKRIRPGDVVEVTTPSGLAYAQFTSVHRELGDVIRVLPGLFDSRPEEFDELVGEEGYFAFYPVRLAAREGLVELVARRPVQPGKEAPTRMRRRGAIDNAGNVLTWVVLSEGGKGSVKTQLSEAERHLPIGAIWNHEMLVLRLSEQWRPEFQV